MVNRRWRRCHFYNNAVVNMTPMPCPTRHTMSFSKYSSFVERGAQPVENPINCVHSYLNIYKSVCVCVFNLCSL